MIQSFHRPRFRGYSLTELMVVCVLLSILSLAVFPVAKFTIRRQKEMELRRSLLMMLQAIYDHKRFSDAGLIPVELGTEGFPAELEVLVEGIELVGTIDRKQKFLRRIPIDPMTGETEWGLRSLQDDFDSESWGGENVYDVYTLSTGTGLNGIPYSEW
ncbi:MAG: prepilin-type N-terminal cleavage/methylation domain-containing protein [Acidobacteriota bacterium]